MHYRGRLDQFDIVLASASPRRKELLEAAGLDFVIRTSDREEIMRGDSPAQIVLELSAQKAQNVGQLFEEVNPKRIIIGADTIVAAGDKIFGKPKDEEDAKRMIRILQGDVHQVYTGVTLLFGKSTYSFWEKTDVYVRGMDETEIEEYIIKGESLDKAGAYGIQGAFAPYVERIEGDYLNVVGLPVSRLLAEMDRIAAMHEIRFVATDIDGTLVKESSPEVDELIPEMLHKLSEKGILCCVASGRQYHSIRNMFREVADEIVYIAENGAHIVYKGQDLSVTTMQKEQSEAIIRKMRSYGKEYDFVISTPKGSLLETGNEEFVRMIRDGYRNKMEVVEDVLSEKPEVIKAAMYHKGSVREVAQKELIPVWKDEVKVCMAGEEWVDFMDKSVDKGNAIAFVQNYFGISPQETMTFGDNENDIGLMEAAAESYAVDNAREPVKKAARHRCPDYTKKGVYETLRLLYEQTEGSN